MAEEPPRFSRDFAGFLLEGMTVYPHRRPLFAVKQFADFVLQILVAHQVGFGDEEHLHVVQNGASFNDFSEAVDQVIDLCWSSGGVLSSSCAQSVRRGLDRPIHADKRDPACPQLEACEDRLSSFPSSLCIFCTSSARAQTSALCTSRCLAFIGRGIFDPMLLEGV